MIDKNVQERFVELVVRLYFTGLTVKESIERAEQEINQYGIVIEMHGYIKSGKHTI